VDHNPFPVIPEDLVPLKLLVTAWVGSELMLVVSLQLAKRLEAAVLVYRIGPVLGRLVLVNL